MKNKYTMRFSSDAGTYAANAVPKNKHKVARKVPAASVARPTRLQAGSTARYTSACLILRPQSAQHHHSASAQCIDLEWRQNGNRQNSLVVKLNARITSSNDVLPTHAIQN